MIAYLPDAEVRTDGHFISDLLPKKLQVRVCGKFVLNVVILFFSTKCR